MHSSVKAAPAGLRNKHPRVGMNETALTLLRIQIRLRLLWLSHNTQQQPHLKPRRYRNDYDQRRR